MSASQRFVSVEEVEAILDENELEEEAEEEDEEDFEEEDEEEEVVEEYEEGFVLVTLSGAVDLITGTVGFVVFLLIVAFTISTIFPPAKDVEGAVVVAEVAAAVVRAVVVVEADAETAVRVAVAVAAVRVAEAVVAVAVVVVVALLVGAGSLRSTEGAGGMGVTGVWFLGLPKTQGP